MGKDVYNIAIVGLGFGAEFIPIHQAHPNLNLVAVCRRNEEELNKVNCNGCQMAIAKF